MPSLELFFFFKKDISFLFSCVCVCVCICACEYEGLNKPEVLYPLEELQVVVDSEPPRHLPPLSRALWGIISAVLEYDLL